MQVSIDFNRKLNQDEKERFSVAIDSCTAAVTVTVVPGKGKKRKRSLKLKTEKQKCVSMGSKEGERFEVVSPEMLETLAKPYAPNNTQLNTQWAMNNFKDWWKWHNSFDRTIDKCPEVVLTPECSAEELNAWLPVYVSETRNKEGKRYSPKTIYSLLVRILRYMTENPRHLNFLEMIRSLCHSMVALTMSYESLEKMEWEQSLSRLLPSPLKKRRCSGTEMF